MRIVTVIDPERHRTSSPKRTRKNRSIESDRLGPSTKDRPTRHRSKRIVVSSSRIHVRRLLANKSNSIIEETFVDRTYGTRTQPFTRKRVRTYSTFIHIYSCFIRNYDEIYG